MTRINIVPVEELSGRHLVAEYRELPRVFNLAFKAHERGVDPKTFPKEYTLGRGHVMFFYSRLWFLVERFCQLVDEMEARGYKPQYEYVPTRLMLMPWEWMKDYHPTEEALAINRVRILERS